MENENSVCFIAKIRQIDSIKDANKIELAFMNGWSSVIQKSVYKEGDLVLCITTDAVIPEDLAIKWGVIDYLKKKSRVRTVKLRGVYSECILVSLSNLSTNISTKVIKEGQNMMELLNIHKYEPLAKEVNYSIPKVYFKWNKIHSLSMWKSFSNYKIHKIKNHFKKFYKDNLNFKVYYKFPNQKNVPNMFNEIDIVIITRKYHGTNARYGITKKNRLSILDRFKKLLGDKWIEYEYVYGSHHKEKGSDSQGFYGNDVWKDIADRYNIKEKLWNYAKTLSSKELGTGIIIYGEIIGPGIQGDLYNYNLANTKLKLFDIEQNNIYLDHQTFCSNSLGVLDFNFEDLVEILYQGNWSKEIQDKFVFNNYIEYAKIPHEGIVVKCVSGNRHKISKVINPDYLTYSEKHDVPDSH